MHSAFLYHAIRAGLDLAIVNAGMLTVYEEIPQELLNHVEDVLFNRRTDATEDSSIWPIRSKERERRPEKSGTSNGVRVPLKSVSLTPSCTVLRTT